MKLALVNMFNDNRRLAVPLGIGYVATYLEQKGGFGDTVVIDLNFEDVVERVKQEKPDVIGMSVPSFSLELAKQYAAKIKEDLDVPIVIGGIHISELPHTLPPQFDFGVVGEGENSALELVQMYEKLGEFPLAKLAETPGVVYRENGVVKRAPVRKAIENLDDIPICDRKWFNKGYFAVRTIHWDDCNVGVENTMFSSRGCPYRCLFCASSRFWANVRLHSAQRFVDEVRYLHEKWKVTHAIVWDDLFVCNPKRVTEIKDGLKAEGLTDKVAYWCQVRTSMARESLFKDLGEMNVKMISFGFESGNERVLRMLKGQDMSVEGHLEAVRLCKKNGIRVSGGFVFGSPTETIAEMKDTLAFMKKLDEMGTGIDVGAYVLTPLPGTAIWDMCKKQGKVDDFMDFNKLNMFGSENPLALDDSVDKEEFKKVYAEALGLVEEMNSKYSGRRRGFWNKLRYYPARSVMQAVKSPRRAFNYMRRILFGGMHVTHKHDQRYD
jgi:anaerobic magnesium-protoporphyrin IX monomethyl ester cyclase